MSGGSVEAKSAFAFYLLIAAVLVALWFMLLPGVLPDEIRQAYLTYFNIVRALTIVIVGVFVLEGIASLITAKLKPLAEKFTL